MAGNPRLGLLLSRNARRRAWPDRKQRLSPLAPFSRLGDEDHEAALASFRSLVDRHPNLSFHSFPSFLGWFAGDGMAFIGPTSWLFSWSWDEETAVIASTARLLEALRRDPLVISEDGFVVAAPSGATLVMIDYGDDAEGYVPIEVRVRSRP